MSNEFQFDEPVYFEAELPPAIPNTILSNIIGKYAAAVAESIQVPFELALINVLGVVASAAQRKFCVQIHKAYTEPLNIFALAVLPPGERKSAVKDICRFPLLEWEKQQYNLMSKNIIQAVAERQIQEEMQKDLLAKVKRCRLLPEREKLTNELIKLKNNMLEPPSFPRLLADDTTPEALAALMAQQNQRIAMIEAEGGFFDTLAGRYSNGVPNIDIVLKAWNGEAIRVDRRHSEPIILNNPALTLILNVQPDILSSLIQNQHFRGRGLLGRMILLLPISRVGCRNIETFPVSEEIKAAYSNMIHRILNFSWNLDTDKNHTPYYLSLTHDAKAKWFNFANQIEKSLADDQELSNMRDWGGKLPGQILHLAGICHIAEYEEPQNIQINTITMTEVLNLAELLIKHAKTAYSLAGTDEAIECAKTILRWLKKNHLNSFTARMCLEKIKGRWSKMQKVDLGLAILEERGFILVDETRVYGRGRPSRNYQVNPVLYKAKL